MPDSGLHTHENVKIVEQTDLQQNIAAEKGFGKYNHELWISMLGCYAYWTLSSFYIPKWRF